MNPANASSASSSDATSASEPQKADPSYPLPKPSNESEYLAQQASAAKKAIGVAFSELSRDLASGADPRVWVKSHPWITLASAAVAGFATAAVAVPSKEQPALRRLKAIERALHPEREAPKPSNGNGHASEKKDGGGLMGRLMHELFAALTPALMSLINAHFSPQPPPEGDFDEQEGPQPGDGGFDGGPDASQAGQPAGS